MRHPSSFVCFRFHETNFYQNRHSLHRGWSQGRLRNGRGTDYLQVGNSAYLKVEFWNGGTYIGTVENNTGGQGVHFDTAQNDAWLSNSMTFAIPLYADIVRFVVVHAYHGTGYHGGSSSVDNLSIEKLSEPGSIIMFR